MPNLGEAFPRTVRGYAAMAILGGWALFSVLLYLLVTRWREVSRLRSRLSTGLAQAGPSIDTRDVSEIGALEPELRSAAEALGLGLRPQLARLAPATISFGLCSRASRATWSKSIRWSLSRTP